MNTIETNYNENSISNFIRWAQERIAKEVRENDAKAEKYGVHNVYTKQERPRLNNPSESQKLALIKEVDKLRRLGTPVKLALKSVNLSNKSYYKYRKQLGLPKYK